MRHRRIARRLLSISVAILGLATACGLASAGAETPAPNGTAGPSSCAELEEQLEEVSRRAEALEWRFRNAEVASTELENLKASRDELKRRWTRDCAPASDRGPAPEWRSCLELSERRSEVAGRHVSLSKRARAAGKHFEVIDRLREEVAALNRERDRRRCPKDPRGP